ncbi:RING-H2 finger protein ATL80-like [Durio zibethinus]|uniref:RING-H2 finger protein ATL80-like n=1 Tax=Durio zibethinus TaxID=66656 RepID=A0A6P5WGM0_DURZI|nr:RING-H2 finger protein ATL80-like [Durio zibethinus]
MLDDFMITPFKWESKESFTEEELNEVRKEWYEHEDSVEKIFFNIHPHVLEGSMMTIIAMILFLSKVKQEDPKMVDISTICIIHQIKTMLLIYWGLILIIGTMAIAIIVFTFVMMRSCANPLRSSSSLPRSTSRRGEKSSSARLNLSPYSASSFKFKKGLENVEATDQVMMECVVCLSRFEDDEDLQQLHRCKHSFHAPCIDMWMSSHSNCPICRTPVDRRAALDFTLDDNSSTMEVLTDISISP